MDNMVKVHQAGKKSVFIAYVLWIFGGIFGLHHFYLRRDRHAFVWWSTLGGFCGIGWLGEIFKIRQYVSECNEDQKFMADFIATLRRNKRPLFSMNRFAGMIMVAYSWGQMFMSAIPENEVAGINWKFLNWLVPVAAAVGVWTVGNVGREKGKLWIPVAAAYAVYPLRYYWMDESVWFTGMVVASSFAFDSFAKEWRREPRKHPTFKRRVAVLGLCACLYMTLWCSYIYFNCSITDSEGDEVPIQDAMKHFFTSPWWVDLKQSLYETYQYAQYHGWYELYLQIIDLSDPHGEQNAYKVLEVGPDSSQQEITASWRRLSRENHPDKVKDPSLQRAAQERFMDIQQAYETLSKIKHRRHKKNKKE